MTRFPAVPSLVKTFIPDVDYKTELIFSYFLILLTCPCEIHCYCATYIKSFDTKNAEENSHSFPVLPVRFFLSEARLSCGLVRGWGPDFFHCAVNLLCPDVNKTLYICQWTMSSSQLPEETKNVTSNEISPVIVLSDPFSPLDLPGARAMTSTAFPPQLFL